MGAGKSTIGRQLAKLLDLDFVDSDREIEQRTGASISLIFELEGESGFRARERAMIDELSLREGIVLATGGGAVLDAANRAHLAERGLVIYLQTSVDQQLKRTARDRNRPLLKSDDPRARLEALMAEREALYCDLAALTVSTDGRNVNTVAKEIVWRVRPETPSA